jgi:chromosome segregation ATPase
VLLCAVGMAIEDLSSEVTSTGPLPASTYAGHSVGSVGADSSSKPRISLISAATSRVVALESELHELHEQHDHLRRVCARKDDDIHHLQELLASRHSPSQTQIGSFSRSKDQDAEMKLQSMRKEDERRMQELAARAKKAEESAKHSKQELEKAVQCAETCKKEIQKDYQRQVAKLRSQLGEAQRLKQEIEDKLIKSEEQRLELQKRLDRRESVIERAQARCKALEARMAKIEAAHNDCDIESISSVLTDCGIHDKQTFTKWAIHAKRKWSEGEDNKTLEEKDEPRCSAAADNEPDIQDQVTSLSAQLDASHQKLEAAASKIEALQAELQLNCLQQDQSASAKQQHLDASQQTHEEAFINSRSPLQEEGDLHEILRQKIQECEALEQAGCQAQQLVGQVVEQLKRATLELQESRASESDVKSQLVTACEKLQALEEEKSRLEGAVNEARAATENQAVRLAQVFEAERQVVAGEFESLRSQFQSLSQEYYNAKAAVIEAAQERDQALHETQTIATKLAFQEQSFRALADELHNATVLCTKLQGEKSELRSMVASMQQDVAMAACQARIGGERELAALQRRAAAAESMVAMLEVKLTDAESRTNVLRLELDASNQRTEAVEALLAELRAEQFRREDDCGKHPECRISGNQNVEAGSNPPFEEATQQERTIALDSMPLGNDEDPSDSHVSINKALEQLHKIAQGLEQLSQSTN